MHQLVAVFQTLPVVTVPLLVVARETKPPENRPLSQAVKIIVQQESIHLSAGVRTMKPGGFLLLLPVVAITLQKYPVGTRVSVAATAMKLVVLQPTFPAV